MDTMTVLFRGNQATKQIHSAYFVNFISSFLRFYYHEKISCMSMRYLSRVNKILSQDNLKFCDTIVEDIESTKRISDHFFLSMIKTCPTSCKKYQFKGDILYFNNLENHPNRATFRYYFASENIQVYQQYLMFEVNDLIGTVGGHSGLFIGFSFYGALNYIFEKLHYYFQG